MTPLDDDDRNGGNLIEPFIPDNPSRDLRAEAPDRTRRFIRWRGKLLPFLGERSPVRLNKE